MIPIRKLWGALAPELSCFEKNRGYLGLVYYSRVILGIIGVF